MFFQKRSIVPMKGFFLGGEGGGGGEGAGDVLSYNIKLILFMWISFTQPLITPKSAKNKKP